MKYCPLCHKEYSDNIEICILTHCNTCGSRNLHKIKSRVIFDPLFLSIVIALITILYGYFFIQEHSVLIMFAGGLSGVLLATHTKIIERDFYECKQCFNSHILPKQDITLGLDKIIDIEKNIYSKKKKRKLTIRDATAIIIAVSSIIGIIIALN